MALAGCRATVILGCRPGEGLLTLRSGQNEAVWLERPAPADHETGEGRAPAHEPPWSAGHYDFVVAACRLPVDLVEGADGAAEWRPSPGGLVSALEPVMRETSGAWIGWSGAAGEAPDPFEVAGMHLVAVGLSADEVRDFYEGFSNATLWPLYHDVIAPPEFRRPWWDAYVQVNQRFARAVAEKAAIGATVWVNDYQLQLVPQMLREHRSDLSIGFFNHIPFPGYEIFAQLPWRRQVVMGLLGANLIGFQRHGDAANFRRACRQAADMLTNGSIVRVPAGTQRQADETAVVNTDGPHDDRLARKASRHVQTATLPISIDSAGFARLVRQEDVRARAREIRQALGEPDVVLLGIDRLDYTKGICIASPPTASCSARDASARCRRCSCSWPARAGSGSSTIGCCVTRSRSPSAGSMVIKAELGQPAGSLPAPDLPGGGDGRPVPGRRCDAGDLAAGRHEPGSQGVRRLPR